MTIQVLTGDPEEIVLGPGVLFCAPISESDPTTVAGVTGASAWREVGYTEDGSAIDLAYKIEQIKVEEEFYSVKAVVTDVEASVAFKMKQAVRENLALAINLGASGQTGTSSIEPPTPGAEVRVKLALITYEGALWLFRRCINGENLQIDRKKAPNAALLPVKFSLEKPTGQQPWICYPSSAGTI